MRFLFSLFLVSAMAFSQTREIIIDTDPGVDDAFALLLALRSPELEILAVTVVAGNVPSSVGLPNALRMVEIGGRPQTPVAVGAAQPLTRRAVHAYYAHGSNGLGDVPFPEPSIKPVSENAVELIRRLVREKPGKVSIVTLGPLTNIALALRADPDLARMIPRVVMMGGSLSGGNTTPSAEFNFYFDPEAAHVIFHSGIPLVMVGLDVTQKARLQEEHVRAMENGGTPASEAAGKLGRSWMNRAKAMGRTDGFGMHDPLAMAVFMDPSIVTLKKYYVDIETTGELTAGETVAWQSAPVRISAPPDGVTQSEVRAQKLEPNVEVAVAVDSPKFFQLLLGRLTSK